VCTHILSLFLLTTEAIRPHKRSVRLRCILSLLTTAVFAALGASLPFASTRAAEKTEVWLEVRSPHFTVMSNASEGAARRLADQFEQFRGVFLQISKNLIIDPPDPVLIFGAKNENTLRVLLPEYWETRGHSHPAGIFVPAQGKDFVAVRLDTESEHPYGIIYHEYTHLILSLNFSHLPVWLNEGFAEFYGTTEVGDRFVSRGLPSTYHLQRLASSKLLPLDVLLAADQKSPYYNEADKTTIFYAESWALVHYLMLSPETGKTNLFQEYLKQLSTGLDSVKAAQAAFGDLGKLQARLEAYVRQGTFQYAHEPRAAGAKQKSFALRTLPSAELAARRGEFYVATRRPKEAQLALEEAIREDPKLPDPHDTLGLMLFNSGNRSDGDAEFTRAIELGSKSHWTYLLHGETILNGPPTENRRPDVEKFLQRATELNPRAPRAFSLLAFLYSQDHDALPRAIEFARKAVQLAPEEPAAYMQLAEILFRAGDPAEGRKIAEQIVASPYAMAYHARAQMLLDRIQSIQQGRKHEIAEGDVPPPKEPSDGNSEPGTKFTVRRPVAQEGRISAVSCRREPGLDLTLTTDSGEVQLHASGARIIRYAPEGWQPPADFNPCTGLLGRQAKILFVKVGDPADPPEIISIEIRTMDK
jgi:tetratricopeptide (TPR) repeat protein